LDGTHATPHLELDAATKPLELNGVQAANITDPAPRRESSDKEVVSAPDLKFETLTSPEPGPRSQELAQPPKEQTRILQQNQNGLALEAELEVVEQTPTNVLEKGELARLMAEQMKIQEERERLSRLQTLSQEEERIKRRIEELGMRGQGGTQE
jgi:hypothetical protein